MLPFLSWAYRFPPYPYGSLPLEELDESIVLSCKGAGALTEPGEAIPSSARKAKLGVSLTSGVDGAIGLS
jgi:hypothetical protein